jgi:hypothetical protein
VIIPESAITQTMNDIISGGASGGIVAVFILGANWAKSFLQMKPTSGTNGEKRRADDREMGALIEKVNNLSQAVRELKDEAHTNQARIAEMSGNMNILTAIIGRHFKEGS